MKIHEGATYDLKYALYLDDELLIVACVGEECEPYTVPTESLIRAIGVRSLSL